MTRLAPRVNNGSDLILRSHAQHGVSKDGNGARFCHPSRRRFAAPQDEGGACGPCSGNSSPNIFVKSATCSGVRKRGFSPRSSR
jgi:hypothetical protein